MADSGLPDSGEEHPRLDDLARVTFAVEAPVRRLVGSGRLNPFPHAGTISVVLLFVVVITGIYITLFYEFGFEASYRSVSKLTAHPIQRFMRSLHRYSSAALVLTTLVHAWRIFVAARFSGPRRWRWATGWTALVIVFLAGVTGYWLLWDERAQLLNEATAAVVGIFNAGSALVSSILTANGSGWQVLVVIWFAHLLTTAAIGYFLWRHLRRSHLPWLPPRLWTGLMIGALALVSLVFPAELLGPADVANIVDQVPIDPFFLFLLPGFAQLPGSWVMVVFLAVVAFLTFLPWLLERAEPEAVNIDAAACTGCELCVVDCPYLALRMVEVHGRSIAEVDATACVACGICIGSCVFDAIDLRGATIPSSIDVAGRPVVIACDRHGRLGQVDDQTELITVRCAGVVSPTAISGLVFKGAQGVQVVGCPPGDCAFGVGNKLAEERLTGERRPRVPGPAARSTTRDFVAPTALRRAIETPGTHLSADPAEIPRSRWRLAKTAAVVLASMLLVGFATTIIFTVKGPESGVLVVVHHRPGSIIAGTDVPSGSPGTPTYLETRLGEMPLVERQIGSGGLASTVVPLDVSPGATYVGVFLVEGEDRTTIHDAVVDLQSGQRLVLTVDDVGASDAAAGEDLFFSSRAGCSVCHSINPGIQLVGPNLADVALVAAERIPGLAAEDYLRRSIVEPDAYVVEGFPAGQMIDNYGEVLTSGEIDSLVEFLMTMDG